MKHLLMLVGLLVAAGLSGCQTAVKKPTAESPNVEVATAGPMTGQYAVFGEQMKRGAEMAVADINAAGGVLGKTLKLEIGDDLCDPKRAGAVAEDLVSKGVVFVAGHFCSSSSIPASEVYADANVLQITPASSNPALTDGAAARGWRHVFRTIGRDDAQGAVAGEFLAEKYKGKNIAIIHDMSRYGKGIADETKKTLNAAGVQEAIYCLLMLNNGFVCESANIENLDPEFADVPIALKRIDDVALNCVMSNSFGFGGTNATLVMRRCDA